MLTTRIIKELKIEDYKNIINSYKENIIVSYHALDHLSNAQRKLFKETELINILIRETPKGVGLQANGRYSAFFRRRDGYIRIVFDIRLDKLNIITFTNTETMPNLGRLWK